LDALASQMTALAVDSGKSKLAPRFTRHRIFKPPPINSTVA
jgi:hypothetical protein